MKDEKLIHALLQLRQYGARVYIMPTGDKIIHVGNSELKTVAEALLTHRCGCLRQKMEDGSTAIIVKKGEKEC